MTLQLPPNYLRADPFIALRSTRPVEVPPNTWTAVPWSGALADTRAAFDPDSPAGWRAPMTGVYQASLTPVEVAYREPFVLSLGILLDGSPDVADGTVFWQALSGYQDDEDPEDRPLLYASIGHTAVFKPQAGQLVGLGVHHTAPGPLDLGISNRLKWTAFWLSSGEGWSA